MPLIDFEFPRDPARDNREEEVGDVEKETESSGILDSLGEALEDFFGYFFGSDDEETPKKRKKRKAKGEDTPPPPPAPPAPAPAPAPPAATKPKGKKAKSEK